MFSTLDVFKDHSLDILNKMDFSIMRFHSLDISKELVSFIWIYQNYLRPLRTIRITGF